MIGVALHRTVSRDIERSDVRLWEPGDSSRGWQDKSPDFRRGHVVGWSGYFSRVVNGACWRARLNVQLIQCPRRRRQHFCGRRAP